MNNKCCFEALDCLLRDILTYDDGVYQDNLFN